MSAADSTGKFGDAMGRKGFTRRAPSIPGAIDWRVIGACAAVALIATLLFALAPALMTSGIDLAGALRSDGGGVLGGRGKARVRSTLVLVQMSLSFVLLVGAGLLIESLQAIRHADPGFRPRAC